MFRKSVVVELQPNHLHRERKEQYNKYESVECLEGPHKLKCVEMLGVCTPYVLYYPRITKHFIPQWLSWPKN